MRVAIQVFHVTTELSRREVTAPALLMMGRHSECEVHVDDDQASRSHARLTLGPKSFILSDTSQNGTALDNGEVVHREHRELPYGTRLHIGAIRVLVAEVAASEPRQPPRQLSGPTLVSGEEPAASVAPPSVGPDVQALRLRLHAELARDAELAGAIGEGAASLKDVALRSRAIGALKRAARDLGGETRDAVVSEVVAEAIGLGPLEPLLADATVEEIEVLDPGAIYVVKEGHRERTTATFTDDERARVVLGRLLALGGVAPGSEGSLFDVRLPDGTHVVAMRRPLAERGTCLHVRKASSRRLGREEAVREGLLTGDELARLEGAVSEGRGVLVTGEAGSGRTTLLRLLANAVSATETILMVEETTELGTWQPRVVAVALRPGGTSGREAIRAASAFRPDRLVVGDCQGEEAIEILGAPGALVRCPALATIRAPSPEDGLAALVQLAHVSADREALRAAAARNIGLVVHVERVGSVRRVQSIQTPWIDDAGRLALRAAT